MKILSFTKEQELRSEMQRIGCDEHGIDIMLPKAQSLLIKIDSISNICANILKQQMLSLGGDAAVSRKTLTHPHENTAVILMGNKNIFLKLCEKLQYQQFGLADLSKKIEILCKENNNFIKPKIMGILNITPDSFSDGGQYDSIDGSKKRICEMIAQGAGIIDIGGESSKPGAEAITLEEEKRRVLPVLESALKEKKCLISIDTTKPELADICLNMGADIINDISGLTDPKMREVIAKNNSSVIIMHSKGKPENMQNNPVYENVFEEIFIFLKKQIDLAVASGIKIDKIFIDPGIGFGKTVEHNLILLKRIKEFSALGSKMVVGVSRKAFIGKILDKDVSERLIGSVALSVYLAMQGVSVLRVHDVRETYEALRMLEAL